MDKMLDYGVIWKDEDDIASEDNGSIFLFRRSTVSIAPIKPKVETPKQAQFVQKKAIQRRKVDSSSSSESDSDDSDESISKFRSVAVEFNRASTGYSFGRTT